MKQHELKHTFARYVSLNIIGMIGLSCYILADTFFIAQGVGADGLAALNLAIPVYSFIHGTGLMIGMGGATRFSISKSPTVFTQSLWYAGSAACVFLLVGLFFSQPLAALLGANAATLENAGVYLKTILCFSPAFLLNNVLLCFVRNDGNPRLSMTAMLAGSFSNILLDYLFVFPWGMGMFGAALATGIAPLISLAILSRHFLKGPNSCKLQRCKPQGRAVTDITALGLSALITELSSGIVIIVLNRIILQLEGNTGVAAYGVVANVALVVMSVFTGIAQGMQPLLSLCQGAGNSRGSKQVLRYGFITSTAVALLVYAAAQLFAGPIVGAFNRDSDPQLAAIAIQGLQIYFAAFFFAGFNILAATYFSAVDQPKKAFTLSFLRGFAIIIPAALLLAALWGMPGVWAAMACTELVVLLVTAGMLGVFSSKGHGV